MKYKTIHPWDLNPQEAAVLQARLRPLVEIAPLRGRVGLVAGADAHYRGDAVRGAVVVVRLPEFETIEQRTAERPVVFPYLPGLFAFREGPVLLDCFEKLTATPEVVIFHGHGICHPRGFGIASHLGLLLGVPAVGCAGQVLAAAFDQPADARGSWSQVKAAGKVVGSALRTREGVRPVIVSPGHRTDLAASRRIVLAACRGFRTPEPLRRAHNLARSG